MKSDITKFSPAPIVADGHCLFSVNAGTPAAIVLENAGAMLNNARDTLHLAVMDMAPGESSTLCWSVFYTLEQVSGLVESIMRAAESASQEATA